MSNPENEIVQKLTQVKLEDELYATLMETNGKYCESWYYFIKLKGNENNLKFLKEQLDKVDWYIIDELSTFDIDIEHLVDAKTAKQMTKVELNSIMFHRKYDGVLEKIDFKFRNRDTDEDKIFKANEVLRKGRIENFIEGEDIDPEDMISDDKDIIDETSSENDESQEMFSESSEDSPPEKLPPKEISRKKGIPAALLKSNLPRFAKKKRKNHKKH